MQPRSGSREPGAHRALVVGAGSIGERHLRCALATGRCEAVGFVEPRAELRNVVAGRYEAAVALASLDAAIVEFRPTVAVVATPAPSHVAVARQLVSAGVHVLIEKPLALDEAGLPELRREVAAAGVTAGVAYIYRSHPVLGAMRQAIVAGEFGTPLELIVVAGQHFPTYRPAYRETYYTRRQSGGGAVQDALTHLLDAGQWLVGPIVRVVADAARLKLDGTEVEDTVHVLARHGADGGVLGSYSLNQHQAPNEIVMTLVGSKGTARFEVHNCRWRSLATPEQPWTERDAAALERDELFRRQIALFLDAVERNAPAACPLPEGTGTLRAARAILASIDATAGWQHVSGSTAD